MGSWRKPYRSLLGGFAGVLVSLFLGVLTTIAINIVFAVIPMFFGTEKQFEAGLNLALILNTLMTILGFIELERTHRRSLLYAIGYIIGLALFGNYFVENWVANVYLAFILILMGLKIGLSIVRSKNSGWNNLFEELFGSRFSETSYGNNEGNDDAVQNPRYEGVFYLGIFGTIWLVIGYMLFQLQNGYGTDFFWVGITLIVAGTFVIALCALWSFNIFRKGVASA
jgi:hypothetical protein